MPAQNRGRGNARGRGQSSRGRGGSRGRGRGGFATPTRYDDYENLSPRHMGLGAKTQKPRDREFGGGAFDRPLLKPVSFVRGSNQPLLVVDPPEEEKPVIVEEVLEAEVNQDVQEPVPETPVVSQPQPQSTTPSLDQIQEDLDRLTASFQKANDAPQSTSEEGTQSAPSVDSKWKPISSPSLSSVELQPTALEPRPNQAPIVAPQPEPTEALFFIDSQPSDVQAATSTSSTHPVLGLDSDSEEDQVVYIPPSRRTATPKDSPLPPINHLPEMTASTELHTLPAEPLQVVAEPYATPDERHLTQREEIISFSVPVKPFEAPKGKKKKQAKREARARRKMDRRVSFTRGVELSDPYELYLPSEDEEVTFDMDVSVGHDKGKGKQKSKSGKQQREDAAVADYIANTDPELSWMLGSTSKQMTIGDLEDEQALREYEVEREMMGDGGWETDEEDELDMAMEEMEILGESEDGSGSEEDSDEEEQEEEESSDGSSSDDEMFVGKNQWDMELDDDIDAILAANPDILGPGGSRKKRKQLFNAVTNGDFSIFDDDNPLFSSEPARKGKGKGKARKNEMFDSEDEFMEELQNQWEQDRKRKSQRKKDRAADRLANNPTKANKKKAKRAGVEVKPKGNINLHVIHMDIVGFLERPDMPSLSLPPMCKRDRVAVHLLAEAYSLTSQSRGSGARRFPILQRTARSTIYGVDKAHINRIIGAHHGDPEIQQSMRGGKGRKGALMKELGGFSDAKRRTPAKGNKSGEIVGHGAAKLADDNVGFRLLSKMGWVENTGVGLTAQGRHEPLSTRMKVGRGGLGAVY